ncbi:MAG TPA: hypothetical protein PKA06_10475, partial [Gemmatales bacterium]|nr:hypothetical protein [Gemmatales bacterium]
MIPFALPADAQFEESPGFLPGPQRHPLKTSLPIFLWLLSSGFLAITALYHVMADGPRAELLSWTASAGAVALLLGATLLARKVWAFTSHRTVDQVSSSLLLMAFVLPSAQLLLTMAVTQDLSYTTYILLLVVGYALLATSAEALLLYTTLCLATWCSCALRGPEVMWVGYVLPWAATVGLSVFIQNRIPLSGLVTSQKTRSSSSVIDVDLAETLREALAERDRALTAKRLAEKEFAEYRVLQDSRIEFLPIVQYLAVQLAQDVSLQEAGPRWLEQLLAPLSAEYGAIWIKAGDQPPKLAVSTSATISSEEQLVHDTLQAGILLQQGSSVGIPLDLGLVGRGVLLVQGAPVLENTMQERYLRTAGALLSLFLRWQQAEVESENHLQHWQQLQEQHRTLQAEFLALQQASKQVQDHFRSQYEAVQQELSTLRSSSCDVNHWKKETERLQQLLETAQTEHDTLTQLLDEAEATIQQLQTQASNSSDVKAFEIRLQVAEAAADTARQQMLKLEQKLKASEAEQMALEKQCDASEQELQRLRSAQARAEEECREVQAEWEREIARVEKLTAAFRTMPEPIALFDTDGVLLCENKPAELLRGNVRLQPGEHPLFELIEPDRFEQKKPWQLPWKHQNIMYQVSITPLLEQKSILGYFITAHNMQEQTQTPVEKAKDESLLAGPRFFAGLAQTLEPPLSQLITHADRLVDVTTDPTIRRQALLGVLQESRL